MQALSRPCLLSSQLDSRAVRSPEKRLRKGQRGFHPQRLRWRRTHTRPHHSQQEAARFCRPNRTCTWTWLQGRTWTDGLPAPIRSVGWYPTTGCILSNVMPSCCARSAHFPIRPCTDQSVSAGHLVASMRALPRAECFREFESAVSRTRPKLQVCHVLAARASCGAASPCQQGPA